MAVADREGQIEIIKKCDTCRLALNDEEYPYIIPLNFGLEVDGEALSHYFHGAREGEKYNLIRKNNKASFEMDCSHKLITSDKACGYTMEFESVVGQGTIEILDDDEKLKGLSALMSQYTDKKDYSFDPNVVKKTFVLKLSIDEMMGKRYKK